MTEQEDIKSTELNLKIIALTDILEGYMIDYCEYLKSIGGYKYKNKMLVKRVLNDCRELSRENDRNIGEGAEEFGEVMDVMKEAFENIFKKSVIIEDK